MDRKYRLRGGPLPSWFLLGPYVSYHQTLWVALILINCLLESSYCVM
jgi:hypothetical protein